VDHLGSFFGSQELERKELGIDVGVLELGLIGTWEVGRKERLKDLDKNS